MNDCKYGYDIKDGVIRLTLLKSAVDPNVDADRETHEFIYSIYPHSGDWKRAGTVNMAYSLNCPMYTKVEEPHEGKLPNTFSFINVDRENVIIEVVKKCEDGDDLVIRAYECYNRRTDANISFYKEPQAVFECDLLENPVSEVRVEGNTFNFKIKPFEIKTFRLKF